MADTATTGTFTLGDMIVNRMGFGAMRITGEGVWGEPPDRAAAREVLQRAVELGINFIDTADSYGPAVSEELIAEALHPYPEGLVIATKGGLVRPGPGQWHRNGHPAHLREACEGSLRRLRLERIDLYQLHAPDPDIPLAESLGEINALQNEGKVRHVGISNVDTSQLHEARELSEIVSVQDRFSLADRENEPVLDKCTADGLGFIPWYPLGSGDMSSARALQHVAERHGASVMQIALAWLLQRSDVMLPIPGTSSVEHLEENVAAAEIELSDEDVAELEGG